MATNAEQSNATDTQKKKAAGLITGRLLLGILVSLAASGGFAWLWDQVKDKDRATTGFDHIVLTWMHTHQAPWATALATGLAFMGSPPVIVGIALVSALVGFFWRKLRGAVWTLPIAVAGAGLIIQGIKLTFHRPRPTLFSPLLHEGGYSFPSGHSLIAIVVYGLIGYFVMHLFHRRTARIAVAVVTTLLILLIGISRPYVQVHYPTDVLAGWTVGLPWLMTCIAIHEGLTRRFAGTGEPVLHDPPPIVNAAAGSK